MALSQNQLELHDRMVTVKERAEAGLLALDAVRGVGVGLRQENGQLTDELAIIVYARGADALTASLPATIEGYPVSVQEADFENQKTESAANISNVGEDKKRYNPLLGGISIAPSRIDNTAGTLGLMVRGNKDGEDAMMLSNYHVMCSTDGKAKIDDEICQEARFDNAIGWGGNCAKLTRWYAGNILIKGKSFGVDAAVALKTARNVRLSEAVSIGKLLGTEEPAVDMDVQKRGRTTELTSGKIQSISATVKNSFGPPTGDVEMENQIVVVGNAGSFTAGGDSGSVYVNIASKKVVGLHWGGRSGADPISVGCNINAVTAALDISIPSAPQDAIEESDSR